MNKVKLVFTIVVLSLSVNVFAQFNINAELRTRGEVLHGWKKVVAPEASASYFVSQRSRLNLNYKNEFYTVKFSVQDVRLWGDEDNYNATGVLGKTTNTLDIYEAWVDLKLGDKSNIKIGRQELKYDDMRLISWRNWWQTGMSYDALLYKYSNKDKGFSADVGLTLNNHTANLTGNDYYTDRMKTMDYVYLKKDFGDKLYLSFTGILTGYQKEGTTDIVYAMGTEGFHLNYNAGKKIDDGLFAKANAFIQNGKNNIGQDVKASMYTAEMGYRLLDKKLAFSAGLDYLSGNDASNTDVSYTEVDHTFDLLYGSRFPYYGGNINQIITNDKSLKGGGLVNPYFKLNYKFAKKTSADFTFHMNYLANNVIATNDLSKEYYDKNLGSNVDLVLTHKFSNEIALKLGGSYGMPSDTFIRMQNVTNANGDFETGNNYFAWTMLIIKPTFFKSN